MNSEKSGLEIIREWKILDQVLVGGDIKRGKIELEQQSVGAINVSRKKS